MIAMPALRIRSMTPNSTTVSLAERRGRLVEHDDARPVDQRPRDLDELLLADRQVAEARPGSMSVSSSASTSARALGHRPAVRNAAARHAPERRCSRAP